METLKNYIKKLVLNKQGGLSLGSLVRPFIFLLIIFAFLGFISGQAPELHTIQGFVHTSSSSQVPSGTKVNINATTTGSFATIQTSGPPGSTGFYSSSINAQDSELVIVTSYNATYYGRSSINLAASPAITRLNLTLNNTRPPETDINITFPSNNSIHDKFDVFNLTFNVTGIGGANSTNCNVTISITNQAIINLTQNNFTKTIGNVSLGNSLSSFFELTALSEGTTVLTLASRCSSDSEIFENLNIESITLRVANQPPQLHSVQGYIFNLDNVTQVPSGTNVTINATETGSFATIQTSGPPGHTGFYSTAINARDGEVVIVKAQNSTHNGIRNVSLVAAPSITRINISLDTLTAYPPFFTNVLVEDDFSIPTNEIDLAVAGTKTINCSGEITDVEGFLDISNVTAVFYDSNNASYNSADDFNNHYTNNSCVLTNCLGLSCEVDCTLGIWYYANSNLSQSWVCRLTGTDSDGAIDYGYDNVSINTLLGVEFADSIDYGLIGSNFISNESTNNVTNRGNVKIDISLDGYGGIDGDQNAMNCTNGRNISIGYEKYNLTASNSGNLNLSQFETLYINLTDEPVNYTGFNLDYRRNDTTNEANKPTYWRIYVPEGMLANTTCSGKINVAIMADS